MIVPLYQSSMNEGSAANNDILFLGYYTSNKDFDYLYTYQTSLLHRKSSSTRPQSLIQSPIDGDSPGRFIVQLTDHKLSLLIDVVESLLVEHMNTHHVTY